MSFIFKLAEGDSVVLQTGKERVILQFVGILNKEIIIEVLLKKSAVKKLKNIGMNGLSGRNESNGKYFL